MRTLASILAVLLALYVGAYFICVRPGVTITFGGWHTSYPDYQVHNLATIFAPLHQLDRQHLRPTLWAKPMTLVERRRIVDLAEKYVLETLTPNKSLQPTPVGVVRSAHAGHVVVPAWLSFGR